MGIDWETILGAEGGDIQRAYDDNVVDIDYSYENYGVNRWSNYCDSWNYGDDDMVDEEEPALTEEEELEALREFISLEIASGNVLSGSRYYYRDEFLEINKDYPEDNFVDFVKADTPIILGEGNIVYGTISFIEPLTKAEEFRYGMVSVEEAYGWQEEYAKEIEGKIIAFIKSTDICEFRELRKELAERIKNE